MASIPRAQNAAALKLAFGGIGVYDSHVKLVEKTALADG
jgi:hypothetical protein